MDEDSATVLTVITEAVTEAFRSEANGPEVAFYVTAALDDAGFNIVRKPDGCC